MYLEVKINGVPPVRLREPQDFKGFKVVVDEGVSGDELAAALAPYADVLPDGDAMVRIADFEQLSRAQRRDPRWLAQFEAMVAYAGSKGWLSEDGGAIRAHCERRTAAA